MPLAAIACLSLAAKHEEVSMASDIHGLQVHYHPLPLQVSVSVTSFHSLLLQQA